MATKKAKELKTVKVPVYNNAGEVVRDLDLNPAIFGVSLNSELLHQIVVALQAARRAVTAHTKFRGEVAGGGKKPWAQKGTGRARQGSIRSPLWKGGGVTFGPRNDRVYEQKINKKMKQKALLMVLSDHAAHGNVRALEQLVSPDFKTKEMVKLMKNLKLTHSVLFVASEVDQKLQKSISNIPKVSVMEARNLNVLDVLKYRHLVVAESAFAEIEKILVKK